MYSILILKKGTLSSFYNVPVFFENHLIFVQIFLVLLWQSLDQNFLSTEYRPLVEAIFLVFLGPLTHQLFKIKVLIREQQQ